jgi:hypothetical protein
VVRHRSLGLVPGYLDPDRLAGLQAGQPIELLRPEGQAHALAPGEVQAVYFVDDFSRAAELRTLAMPGRAAARLPGVWVRVRWRGQASLDGILAADLLHLDRGLELTPLRDDSPWQRVFVPTAMVDALTVVDVVHPPRRRRPLPAQIDLFTASGTKEKS